MLILVAQIDQERSNEDNTQKTFLIGKVKSVKNKRSQISTKIIK